MARQLEGVVGILDPLATPAGQVDVTFANIEGSLGGGRSSGFPRLHHLARLAGDLATLDFDVVSTATHHGLGAGRRGLARTLACLDDVGIRLTGTRRDRTKP